MGGGVVSGKASLENAGAFVAEQVSNVSAQILMCWRCPDSGDTGLGEQAGDRAGQAWPGEAFFCWSLLFWSTGETEDNSQNYKLLDIIYIKSIYQGRVGDFSKPRGKYNPILLKKVLLNIKGISPFPMAIVSLL